MRGCLNNDTTSEQIHTHKNKCKLKKRKQTFNLHFTRTSGFRPAPAPLRHHEVLNKKRMRQEKKNRDGPVDDRKRQTERTTPTARQKNGENTRGGGGILDRCLKVFVRCA